MILNRHIKRRIPRVLLRTGLAVSAGIFALFLVLPTHGQETIATEGPVKVSKDVDISADELEANLRKDIVIFVGNVVVRQEDLTLTSDRVTVFYQDKVNEGSSITRIDASGSVKLTTQTETIHSTWGIYDFAEKIVTLGGKVVLKRSDGEIEGKRLLYNLETGLITIEGNPNNRGRVTGQFKLPENTKKEDQ